MTPEQEAYQEKLREALRCGKHPDQARQFKEKYGAPYWGIMDEAAQKLADLYPTLCALDEGGEKATKGEWEIFHKGDTTDVHLAGERDKEFVGGPGFEDGELSREQHGDNAGFIVTAANGREAIEKAVRDGKESE